METTRRKDEKEGEREKESDDEKKKEGYRIGKKDEGSFCMLLLLVLLVAGSALFPKKIKQPTVSLLSFFFLLFSLAASFSVYVRACQISHSHSSLLKWSLFFCLCLNLTDFVLLLLHNILFY